MANDSSTNGSNNLFGRLSTLATLLRAGRAASKGKIDRTVLLVGAVLIGRRSPRLGYLLQLADTANEIRKRRR